MKKKKFKIDDVVVLINHGKDWFDIKHHDILENEIGVIVDTDSINYGYNYAVEHISPSAFLAFGKTISNIYGTSESSLVKIGTL